MSENKKSPQSERLALFVQKTGYSVNEFGKQCGISSSSTMQGIIVQGKAPTSKVLDKIITRFPQLNHDWVILGYGEMIVPGMSKQVASGTSVLKSKGASFQQISDKQIETSFGINELARRVNEAMAISAQTNQMLTNKVEQLAITLKEGQEFIKDSEAKRDAFFEKNHADELIKIKSLDNERRVQRDEAQEKLSQKIYNYLKESRELSLKEIEKHFQRLEQKIIDQGTTNTTYALDKVSDMLHQEDTKIGKHSVNKKN